MNKTNAELEAMREQAVRSGLSYNQAKLYIARTTGGKGTRVYSDTDVAEVRRQNEQAEAVNVKFGQNN